MVDLIAAGDAEAVRRALGADPSLAAATDAGGLSALMLAQYRLRDDLVALVRGALPRLTIFEAAAIGDLPQLEAALTADPASVRAVAPDGFQALHLACYFGRAELVDRLLAAGADPNAVAANPTRLQPLHSAAAADRTDIVASLLAAGADPNVRQEGGWTPLHEAYMTGNAAMQQLLLAHGADPDALSDDGRKPAQMVSA